MSSIKSTRVNTVTKSRAPKQPRTEEEKAEYAAKAQARKEQQKADLLRRFAELQALNIQLNVVLIEPLFQNELTLMLSNMLKRHLTQLRISAGLSIDSDESDEESEASSEDEIRTENRYPLETYDYEEQKKSVKLSVNRGNGRKVGSMDIPATNAAQQLRKKQMFTVTNSARNSITYFIARVLVDMTLLSAPAKTRSVRTIDAQLLLKKSCYLSLLVYFTNQKTSGTYKMRDYPLISQSVMSLYDNISRDVDEFASNQIIQFIDEMMLYAATRIWSAFGGPVYQVTSVDVESYIRSNIFGMQALVCGLQSHEENTDYEGTMLVHVEQMRAFNRIMTPPTVKKDRKRSGKSDKNTPDSANGANGANGAKSGGRVHQNADADDANGTDAVESADEDVQYVVADESAESVKVDADQDDADDAGGDASATEDDADQDDANGTDVAESTEDNADTDADQDDE